jgi:S-formylglutathione hydrolase FrmB
MTWPTLYMIPGSHSAVDYQSWTAYTDIESFMSPKDVLVVMPTDGPAGYSSNEIFGGPDYGTFQGVEVPQIMLAAYRSSGRNVVAGLSSGGVGAFDLAAEHPNQYRAAASYSGPLDTQFPDIELIIQTDLISAGESPFSLWGDPLLNANVWAAHNPRVLASRLRGTALFVSAGNGLPGPLDDLTSFKNTVGGGLLEAPALSDDYSFLAAAWLAGDHVTTDFYGPGTHIWPYWQRELHRSWPFLANGLGVPAT